MSDAVQIMLNIDVVEILEVNDSDFSATFMLYFGASWKEPRIRNNATARIPVDVSIFDKLWVPDIYIYNMKKFKREKIFTELAGKCFCCKDDCMDFSEKSLFQGCIFKEKP